MGQEINGTETCGSVSIRLGSPPITIEVKKKASLGQVVQEETINTHTKWALLGHSDTDEVIPKDFLLAIAIPLNTHTPI